MEREKQAMIKAAEAAGEVLREWFHKAAAHEGDRDAVLGVQCKNEHFKHLKSVCDNESYEDVFTHADIESEEKILSILKQCRDIPIRSEESYPDEVDLPEGAQRWLVDPLDGTSRFKKGLPDFSITIALQTKREGEWHTDIGVVALPMEKRLFIADAKGAELKDESGICPLQKQQDNAAIPVTRREALKGKAVEVVVYSKSDKTLMDARLPFVEALKAMEATPQATYSTAMVMARMASEPSVDAVVLAGDALEFPWDSDAGIYIAAKAGVTVKRSTVGGEPCVILAHTPALATALERMLREQYQATSAHMDGNIPAR